MFNDRIFVCKALTIAVFSLIVLGYLIILSIGVHNDLPTTTTGYTEVTEFSAPIIGMQLKNNFTITCHFLIFNYYGNYHIII